MVNYIRYCPLPLLYYPLVYGGILLGHKWPLSVMLFNMASQILVDNCAAPDTKIVSIKYPALLNFYLYMHLPLGVGIVLLMLWQAAPGDLWGIADILANVLGPWLLEAHANSSLTDLISCGLLVGLALSTNTLVGHELVHRLSNPVSATVGRWLLAINCDAQFSISHVYGHHRNVGTDKDPATARRGEPLYTFVFRSTIGQYKEAIEIEQQRLAKKGLKWWSTHNRLLTAIGMSALIVIICYALAGWAGLGLFILAVCFSKFLFETFNYIQHYGIVRVPGTQVELRHSWDCISRACTNTFFALPRHSHHHVKPTLHYWELEPSYLAVKSLITKGYITTMFMAMVPPLWFYVTTPLLLKWDREVATEDELKLVKEANRRSGISQLINQ